MSTPGRFVGAVAAAAGAGSATQGERDGQRHEDGAYARTRTVASAIVPVSIVMRSDDAVARPRDRAHAGRELGVEQRARAQRQRARRTVAAAARHGRSGARWSAICTRARPRMRPLTTSAPPLLRALTVTRGFVTRASSGDS